MHVIALDTLKYSKKLIEAGIPQKQAEAQAYALAEVIDDQLVTKKDFKDLEYATKRDLKELENATKRDLKELEANVDIKLHKLENRLMTKVGALIATSTGLTITVVGILISMHT